MADGDDFGLESGFHQCRPCVSQFQVDDDDDDDDCDDDDDGDVGGSDNDDDDSCDDDHTDGDIFSEVVV